MNDSIEQIAEAIYAELPIRCLGRPIEWVKIAEREKVKYRAAARAAAAATPSTATTSLKLVD